MSPTSLRPAQAYPLLSRPSMKTLGLPTRLAKITQPDMVNVYTEACKKPADPGEDPHHTMSRGHQFAVGDVVLDTHQESPNPAVVLNLPPKYANEWIAYADTTVAEDNPEYPRRIPHRCRRLLRRSR